MKPYTGGDEEWRLTQEELPREHAVLIQPLHDDARSISVGLETPAC